MNLTIEETIIQLQKGKVVALPTDTVWGISANALHSEAVDSLFRLKQRSRSQPIPLLISRLSSLFPLLEEEFLQREIQTLQLIDHYFWPGPLTLILPSRKEQTIPLSPLVQREFSIAFRIPQHPLLLHLLNHLKTPLATTSANHSGKPPLSTTQSIRSTFGDDFPILKAEFTGSNTASMIVKYEAKNWILIREGDAISFQKFLKTIA